jgi:hypothetical protein
MTGGFFVGVAATIDQHNGLYHFVTTDTSQATIFTVDLKTLKSTSAATNDYGPELTSLTWNSKDGKLYAVAQTDVTTVDVLTVDPKTGTPTVLSQLDLSANDGLTFQDPAAFNFDTQSVTLVVQYGGSSRNRVEPAGAGAGADAGAACPTQAIYTYSIQNGNLLSNADVKMPAGTECLWTPVRILFASARAFIQIITSCVLQVTQDFAHTF